jgi:hypothetical protein
MADEHQALLRRHIHDVRNEDDLAAAVQFLNEATCDYVSPPGPPLGRA